MYLIIWRAGTDVTLVSGKNKESIDLKVCLVGAIIRIKSSRL